MAGSVGVYDATGLNSAKGNFPSKLFLQHMEYASVLAGPLHARDQDGGRNLYPMQVIRLLIWSTLKRRTYFLCTHLLLNTNLKPPYATTLVRWCERLALQRARLLDFKSNYYLLHKKTFLPKEKMICLKKYRNRYD